MTTYLFLRLSYHVLSVDSPFPVVVIPSLFTPGLNPSVSQGKWKMEDMSVALLKVA